MRKTHWIELIRNIRENKIAFCAIVLFIALGIAVFIGFNSAGNSFLQSVNTMAREQKLNHFEVYMDGGVTDSDIDDCADWDGIDKAEGKIEGFSVYKWNGKNCNARLNSITEKLDKLCIEEGELPEKDDEVAVEQNYAESKGIKVGDKISFTSGQDESLLKNEDYKVSAIVKSSAYFSKTTITYGMTRRDSKPVDGVFYFDEDAFMIPYYTSVLLYSNKLAKLDTFSDEYKNKSDKIKAHIKKKYLADDDTITDRSSNGAISLANTAGSVIINLRYSLSLIFVAIAILICYSTIERLIREQSVLIGTKKSLGMTRAELRTYYSTFSLMAILTGVAIGTALGMLVIQPVVYNMTAENFIMTAKTPYFSTMEYLLITVVQLVLIMLATLLTVDKIVKKDAITLINDINQKNNKAHFYEKTDFYKRISLLSKTMMNNIFSDRKRCIATFLSVAGCTVLIACSLFMNHSISSSVDSQFEKYYHFNDMVYIDTQVDTAEKEVADILARKKIPYAKLYQTSGLVSKGKNPASYVGYYVPKDESFYDVVELETTKGKKISNVHGDYLSEAFMNEYKLSSGDKVKLKDNQGHEITAKIDNAFRYYLISNQMVISRNTFEKLSDEKYQTNTFFIDTTDVDRKALQKELEDVDGFSSYSEYRNESVERVKTFTNAAKAVVIVYLLLSVVMALLVVLNLLNMYVMEKKKEIVVLMINGYEKKPIRKYIFSDTVLISIIGIIAGDIIGTAAGTIVTGTFITADMTFSLAPNILVCLIGAGIAGVIVLVTVLISMRKMNAFRLTDI